MMARCKHLHCSVGEGNGFNVAIVCNDCGRRHLSQGFKGPRGGWGRDPKWVDAAFEAERDERITALKAKLEVQ